jgi:hypothetical protein
MAWKARVVSNDPDDKRLSSTVVVGFYIDTDPWNIPEPTVYIDKIPYPSSELTTVPNLIAAVQSKGAEIRAKYDRVLAVKAALPVGSEVPIP